MPFTPNFAIPYQTLADPPDGPNLGEDGFLAVDAALAALDARIAMVANSAGINNAAGAGTHSTASYANVPATSSFSFTKLQNSTALRVDFHLTFLSTVNSTEAGFGVLINGVDYDVCQVAINESNSHRQVSGVRRITGITAGVYTIQARWKRVSGTGVLTTTGDWISLHAMEEQ